MSQRALFALALTLGLLPGCKKDPDEAASTARPEASALGPQSRIEISVTDDGFVASGQRVKVGEPVTLVVTRKVERTCATEIVLKDYGLSQPLPQNQTVEVTFTPTKLGPIRYACAMDMVAGNLVAE
ncbi:MAG: hypothetical protein K0R38_1395 [Polyangiaceae bacterium]|nr:hypothetical protein [Polyangiaceae bacterium]